MSELAKKLIADAKLTRATSLDLSYTGMTEVPEELFELVWLEELVLDNLRRHFTKNKGAANLLTAIPPKLNRLRALKSLRITSNHKFKSAVADLSPLAGIDSLQSLSVYDTQVADLSPLAGLASLQSLNVTNSQVADLSPLAGIDSLKALYVHSTQVSDLSPLAGLVSLQMLDVRYTQVADLSPLKGLIKKGIPVEITLESIKGIYVEDCPLINPPVEIVKQGNEAILRYFANQEKRRPLNEVKVILVGEGAAGKTSLVKAISGEPFDKKESQTHGIRIKKMVQPIAGDAVKIHFWDFGGQEIMHATHQFFLSKRSVYLLVLDSRRDDKSEYWLKHIESFGGNSPILVVLNKMDENPGFRVNEQFLQEKYPNIIGFYMVSCSEKKQGIKDLKGALCEAVHQMEMRKALLPESWFQVKEHFSETKEDFISETVFREICQQKGLKNKAEQKDLLNMLNDLGIVLHYDTLSIHDTEVLNPLWLTNGVYRVINSPLVAEQKGWFSEQELESIIEDERYQPENPKVQFNIRSFFSKGTPPAGYRFPKDKYAFLVGMMKEFELCFAMPNGNRYVVPELLPIEDNRYPLPTDNAVLKLVVHYPDFLPTSIFPRLMVRLHEYIHEHRKWRTGMTLSGKDVFNAIANIIADKEAKNIKIVIEGSDARRFLTFIRVNLRNVNMSFVKLNWMELIPLPDKTQDGKTIYEKYSALEGMRNMGVDDYVNGDLQRKYSVNALLGHIEEIPLNKTNLTSEGAVTDAKLIMRKLVQMSDSLYRIEKMSDKQLRLLEKIGASQEHIEQVAMALGQLSHEQTAEIKERLASIENPFAYNDELPIDFQMLCWLKTAGMMVATNMGVNWASDGIKRLMGW